jgi:NAD-dependent SIR2 family protein deacetylase
MATYHGLIELNCLVCNWKTEDPNTIERVNDYADVCPQCEEQFFRWVNEDGTISVSLTKPNGDYDNLIMNW